MDRSIVLYDRSCGFCRCVINLVRTLDFQHCVSIRGISGDHVTRKGRNISQAELLHTLHLETPTGKVYTGYRACRRLALAVPALWLLVPLLYFPGSSHLGDPAYQWVAGHRTELSRWLGLNRFCDGFGT